MNARPSTAAQTTKHPTIRIAIVDSTAFLSVDAHRFLWAPGKYQTAARQKLGKLLRAVCRATARDDPGASCAERDLMESAMETTFLDAWRPS